MFTKDLLPAVEAARDAGMTWFEAGGGARFQSLYFYCNENAFDMMDAFRETAGPEANKTEAEVQASLDAIQDVVHYKAIHENEFDVALQLQLEQIRMVRERLESKGFGPNSPRARKA